MLTSAYANLINETFPLAHAFLSGPQVLDLLNGRYKVDVLEDGKGRVQVR